jgi:hypothetical protein
LQVSSRFFSNLILSPQVVLVKKNRDGFQGIEHEKSDFLHFSFYSKRFRVLGFLSVMPRSIHSEALEQSYIFLVDTFFQNDD